ncbi:hypothetical protein GCM10007918_19740 [Piscinibacter gummiphilus]|nr:hypothetical protein GCM10007918_19740 [Piscinibacter gummiphilus]
MIRNPSVSDASNGCWNLMNTMRLPSLRPAFFWLSLLLLCALAAGPVRAQDTASEADPPGRVGRLAEVEGEVWVYDNEESEWVEAARNRPITTGDRLSSSGSGRAEVRVGTSILRIGRNTELEVTALDDDHFTVRLHNGDVAARLRSRESAQDFLLVTSEGGFAPERAGSYRFTRDDDTTDATVQSGQLQLKVQDAGVTVKAGQRYRFWQDRGTQFELAEPGRDDFDDWVAARDDREDRSVSTRYVSAEMTGVEDLDRYGRWEQDPEYGALWIPRDVAPGWAPYRVGHWVWISPWGWTWVDDAPWGFAPFHYGRWVSRRDVWCWVPGAYVARPVYAPALVAWVGGPGVSVSIGVGRRPAPMVGWFPLGPREVYVPGHRYSPHYMRHINGNQVPTNFDFNPWVRDPRHAVESGRYRYRDLPGAVTIVPRQVVERRQPVGPAIVGIGGRPLPGLAPGRPRPDAPVNPGGRPPMMGQRPSPQVGFIPPAPGAGGDRYGAPRFGRDERRDNDGRGRGEVIRPQPQPQVQQPQPVPQQQPQPQPRPVWGGNSRDERWQGTPRDERWQQAPLRPIPQPGFSSQQPQPQPQQQPPRWSSRDENDGRHGGGAWGGGRPQPPQQQMPAQPQPPVQMPRPQPPNMQTAVPRPQPQPQPQVQPQPQPQQQPGFREPPRGGGNPQNRDDGARHRRVD